MAKISSYTVDTTVEGTDLLIGTDAGDNNNTKNYTVQSIATFAASNLLVTSSAPASSTSAGTAGQIAFGLDTGVYYLYVCIATDTWQRVALDATPF
jgi:hypothetical protein